MKDMKKMVLALILVLWSAVAPLAFAQPGAESRGGLFAPLGEFFALILELVHPGAGLDSATGGDGDGSEFMGYTIPGG